jgi:hypothetical protein
MPRYLRSPQGRGVCGPILVINAKKWAGCRATSRLLPEMCQKMNYSSKIGGTPIPNVFSTLIKETYYYLRVHEEIHPSLAGVERHIRNGGSVVITFADDEVCDGIKQRDTHTLLIIDISPSGKTFYVVNDRESKRAVSRMSRNRIRFHMRRRRRGEWQLPEVWYLSLRNT